MEKLQFKGKELKLRPLDPDFNDLLRAAIELIKAFEDSNLKYQDWIPTSELNEGVDKLETEILKSL